MHSTTHIRKENENTSRAEGLNTPFSAHQSEAKLQSALQQKANNSLQVKQGALLQQKANESTVNQQINPLQSNRQPSSSGQAPIQMKKARPTDDNELVDLSNENFYKDILGSVASNAITEKQGEATDEKPKSEGVASTSTNDVDNDAQGDSKKEEQLQDKQDPNIKLKADAIWRELEKRYNDNKNKGKEKWDEFKETIKGHINKSDLLKNQLTEKNTQNTKIFKSNYGNRVLDSKTSSEEDEGISSEEDLEMSSEEKKGVYKVDTEYKKNNKDLERQNGRSNNEGYSNEFDIENGIINAKHNFKNTNESLGNSEILYQQYKLAASEHYKDEGDSSGEVKEDMKNIKKITRNDIINGDTLITLYMARDDINSPTTLNPNNDEFNAVLNTPNVKSSVFMLKDHIDEMEKIIKNIELTSKDALEVNLKSLYIK